MSGALDRIKAWVKRLKRDVVALWLAARDPRVPFGAKIIAAIVAAYALSPIDLIPDFIPVLGLLDNLLLVPAGVWLAIRLVPEPLMLEFRGAAGTRAGRPTSYTTAAVIVLVWLAGAAVLVALWRDFASPP